MMRALTLSTLIGNHMTLLHYYHQTKANQIVSQRQQQHQQMIIYITTIKMTIQSIVLIQPIMAVIKIPTMTPNNKMAMLQCQLTHINNPVTNKLQL